MIVGGNLNFNSLGLIYNVERGCSSEECSDEAKDCTGTTSLLDISKGVVSKHLCSSVDLCNGSNNYKKHFTFISIALFSFVSFVLSKLF